MTQKPTWFKLDEKEVDSLVLKLAKKGMTSEKIGLVLRDQYGIPTLKVFNKKISQILKKEGINSNPDLANIEKKMEKLKKHNLKNIQDKITKRKIAQLSGRIRKLKKYHKIA